MMDIESSPKTVAKAIETIRDSGLFATPEGADIERRLSRLVSRPSPSKRPDIEIGHGPIQDIMRVVAGFYGKTLRHLVSKSHDRRVRRMAMHMAVLKSGRSLREIGMTFGGRPESSVKQHSRQISSRMSCPAVRREIDLLGAIIDGRPIGAFLEEKKKARIVKKIAANVLEWNDDDLACSHREEFAVHYMLVRWTICSLPELDALMRSNEGHVAFGYRMTSNYLRSGQTGATHERFRTLLHRADEMIAEHLRSAGIDADLRRTSFPKG